MASIFKIKLKRDELDQRFGGGIPKSSVMLIEAPNAVGKSLLAQRICYGILFNEQSATYISTELSLHSFINQMNSLDYSVEQHILGDKLLFISMFPYMGKVKVGKSFINRIVESQHLFEKDVFILDTFSDLILNEESNVEEFFEVVHSFKKITSMGKSIVVCVDPDQLKKKYMDYLRNLSDVYIKLYIKEVFGVSVTALKIERFMGAAGDVAKEVPIKVKAGIGLIVEQASGA